MGFKFWDSWLSSRANTKRRTQKTGRRQAPSLEALEERTLLTSNINVVFDAGSGPLPALDVYSYSWGATRETSASAPTSGRAAVVSPSLQDFTLTLPAGQAEPELWGDLTAGTHLKSATIDVSEVPTTSYDHTVGDLAYSLTDVTITSFTTFDDSSADVVPVDTLQLQFRSVAESYDGNYTGDTTNTAAYDQATGVTSGTASLNQPGSHSMPPVGLSFINGGVTEPELTVDSYSWGATNAATGGSAGAAGNMPSLQDFTLTLDPTSAEPALWNYLTTGQNLDAVVLHVRNSDTNNDDLIYTLTDVSITSFTSSCDGRAPPEDTIQLAFKAVTETDNLGSVPNTAQYDQGNPAAASAGSVSGSGAALTANSLLTFTDHGVRGNPLAVTSYSWGVTTSPARSNPGVQTFTLTLDPASAEPGLWGNLTAGTVLDSARIETSGGAFSYTLTDVTIVSFTTSSGTTSPVDTVQLAFGKIAETATESDPDSATTLIDTAVYDSTTPAHNNAGSLAEHLASDSPPLGINFVEGGVTEPELAVASYAWGATYPAVGVSTGVAASLQTFTLTLDAFNAEPALWGHLLAGTHLDSATIHVLKNSPEEESVEYATYTLTDVTIASFTTQGGDTGDPMDTIQLVFGTIAESRRVIENDGELGAANTAQYDQATATSEDPGSLGAPVVPQSGMGLTLVDHGVTENALAVGSYSWGATNPTATNNPALQTVTLLILPTSAEPGLWGHLVAGSHLDSATLDIADPVGNEKIEHITYTFTDVTITSFATVKQVLGEGLDTIQLSFGSIAESYKPMRSDGSLGAADTAQYDELTATSEDRGSLAAPALTTTPDIGLTFVDQRVTENALAVTSCSWGATISTARGSPALQTFTLTLADTSAEPGLWGHLVAGSHLDSATIDVHYVWLGGATEDFIYTLKDVIISSFTTSAANSRSDTVQLDFVSVTESYVEKDANGNVIDYQTAEYNRAADTNASIATATALSASQTSTTYGQAVVFTAIVSPVAANTAAPAGTVDFFDGTTDLSGPVALTTVGDWQEATFTTTALDALHAPHSITAVYNGNAAFAASTSNAQAVAVSPATLTITALDQTKMYGATLPTLTTSYSGFANGDTTASLTALPTLSTSATAKSNVGDYAITISGGVDPNYNIYCFDGTLHVTPVLLTVTVNNTTSVYGAPLPAFTAIYSGFVNGDGPSLLGGALTFSTAATAASTPGYYAVSASGLTDANYQIQYVSGTLTIEANAYQVVPDALDATKSVLVVGGSPHSETIFVAPGSRHGTLALFINGVKHDNIAPATGMTFSRVRIYGGAGNDILQVSDQLTLTSELYGDSGNDVLIGGGGNNILVGGTGHSTLIGGAGRNILIGGSAGGDELIGGRGDNLEIAGSTVWDQNTFALDRIMAEWASNDSYAARVADILGDASNPAFSKRQNGPCFLNASTVHSATERDVLIAGDSRDLFFAELARSVPRSARDRIVGRTKGDVVEELSTSTT